MEARALELFSEHSLGRSKPEWKIHQSYRCKNPMDLDDFPVFSDLLQGYDRKPTYEGANMKGDLIFAQYGIAQPDHKTRVCLKIGYIPNEIAI